WKQATGIEMIDGIGGTEMIHVFVSSPPDQVRPGAIGRVVPGYAACVVDDDMQPVPNGTPGRLPLEGPDGGRYLAAAPQRRLVPAYVACVVEDDMQPVPNGTPGRLALKGPTGCRYLADERQRRFVQQGWNLPGDTFIRDDDGYFFYQARNDDMIVSAGYNIAGPEVEDALLRHEAVAECGVVGAPDEERG